MRIFKDIFIVFQKEIKEYWRWKLHIVFDAFFPLLDTVLFIIIWSAILKGGFEGYGMITKENYIGFLISGMIVWSFARNYLSGEFTRIFVEEKHRRTIQYLLSSPINRMAIPYGKSLLPVLRSIFNSIILISVGLSLGFVFKGNPFLILLIIFLTFLTFSGIGLTIAALGSWREDIADSGWLIYYIFEITAGIYFPLDILPGNIKNIFFALPQAQAVQAMRMLVLENAGIYDILPFILALAFYSLVMIFCAFFAFRFVERKAMLVGI
ncbi:MAG: ABC transporter permease [Thermoplasmatales archaeon]|nr:ABC transporter permease [Thermoplasmatales archaeon]